MNTTITAPEGMSVDDVLRLDAAKDKVVEQIMNFNQCAKNVAKHTNGDEFIKDEMGIRLSRINQLADEMNRELSSLVEAARSTVKQQIMP